MVSSFLFSLLFFQCSSRNCWSFTYTFPAGTIPPSTAVHHLNRVSTHQPGLHPHHHHPKPQETPPEQPQLARPFMHARDYIIGTPHDHRNLKQPSRGNRDLLWLALTSFVIGRRHFCWSLVFGGGFFCEGVIFAGLLFFWKEGNILEGVLVVLLFVKVAVCLLITRGMRKRKNGVYMFFVELPEPDGVVEPCIF